MDKDTDLGSLAMIGENAHFLNKVQEACDAASKNLAERANDLVNVKDSFAQGNFAESWHAETFNVDATLKRMDNLKAEILKSNELNSVDVSVSKEGEVVKEYSSKYYKSGKESVDAQKGYDDQERLIPSDQIDDAEKYISRQSLKDAETRPGNVEQLREVKSHLTDKVEHDGVNSQPLGRSEMEHTYKDFKSDNPPEIHANITDDIIFEEVAEAGAIALAITTALNVAPKIYNGFVDRVKTGEWPDDLLKTVISDSVPKGSLTLARTGISTSIAMTAKAGLLGEAMRSLDPTMIGTLTFIAFEGIKDYRKFSNGEITGEIYADRMMAKSLSATAGVYGAAIGQTIIPIPIVGALIGAAVGSIASQFGYKALNAVTETYFRSEQFEQLKNVNIALAKQWVDVMQNYEDWLQNNRYYQNQKNTYVERNIALDLINTELNKKLMNASNDDE